MELSDLHRFCRQQKVGGFPRNVHVDFLIFLDVLHLRATLTNKVTVQRILRTIRQGVSLRRGSTSQCCGWSSSLSQPFQRTDGSEFVFSDKSNSSMVSFTFTMSAMTWQPAPVTSQSTKVNILIYCSIKFSVVITLSVWSGCSRSSLAESLAGPPAGLPVGS